jgi:hypothetical protein
MNNHTDKINVHATLDRRVHRLARLEAERTGSSVSEVIDRALAAHLAHLAALLDAAKEVE